MATSREGSVETMADGRLKEAAQLSGDHVGRSWRGTEGARAAATGLRTEAQSLGVR